MGTAWNMHTSPRGRGCTLLGAAHSPAAARLPKTAPKTSTLPSPPTPKGSWSQQCLVSIEFSSVPLSRDAFAVGVELIFCTSQHLSGVITPQRTAAGADSHNHHFGAVLAKPTSHRAHRRKHHGQLQSCRQNSLGF